ncbi:hypothetical protein J6590_072256 [Homalodisca vitripennis]|nr:hypothetical protein J6590_072256 [Homalodisca vitripennis]
MLCKICDCEPSIFPNLMIDLVNKVSCNNWQSALCFLSLAPVHLPFIAASESRSFPKKVDDKEAQNETFTSFRHQRSLFDKILSEVNVSDSDDDDSCIVCMAEPRCCALTPCGHRAYCETCCLRLIELDQMCSLCRRKADGYLIIYL